MHISNFFPWIGSYCGFFKHPNILSMSRVYHNRSFKPLVPSHFSTQNKDMYCGIIGLGLNKIKSHDDVL